MNVELQRLANSIPPNISIPLYNPYGATFHSLVIRNQAGIEDDTSFIEGINRIKGREPGVDSFSSWLSLLHIGLVNVVYKVIDRCIRVYIYKQDVDKETITKNEFDAIDDEEDDDEYNNTRSLQQSTVFYNLHAKQLPTWVLYLEFIGACGLVNLLIHPINMLITWRCTAPLESRLLLSNNNTTSNTATHGNSSSIVSFSSLIDSWHQLVESGTLITALPTSVFLLTTNMVLTDFIARKIRKYLNIAPSVESIKKQKKEKKTSIILSHTWRKLCWFSMVNWFSNWLSSSILYPLNTVRYCLEAQGSSYLLPIKYKGFIGAFKALYNSGSLYNGYSYQLASVLPAMGFATIINWFLFGATIYFISACFEEDNTNKHN